MAARASGGLITFGIINIVLALMPMCCGCWGMGITMVEPDLKVANRQFGPEFKKHNEAKIPVLIPEAIGAAICNNLFSVLLIAGAIGLFLAQSWGRWLTIGAAVFLILTLCVHDVYQLVFSWPVQMEFFERRLPPGPDRDGAKLGITLLFGWNCFNVLIMVYLGGMSIFLGMTTAFDATEHRGRRRRRIRSRDDDDDEDDDRPRRRRRRDYEDDEDDDDRPPRRRRRSRDDDDDY